MHAESSGYRIYDYLADENTEETIPELAAMFKG